MHREVSPPNCLYTEWMNFKCYLKLFLKKGLSITLFYHQDLSLCHLLCFCNEINEPFHKRCLITTRQQCRWGDEKQDAVWREGFSSPFLDADPAADRLEQLLVSPTHDWPWNPVLIMDFWETMPEKCHPAQASSVHCRHLSSPAPSGQRPEDTSYRVWHTDYNSGQEITSIQISPIFSEHFGGQGSWRSPSLFLIEDRGGFKHKPHVPGPSNVAFSHN